MPLAVVAGQVKSPMPCLLKQQVGVSSVYPKNNQLISECILKFLAVSISLLMHVSSGGHLSSFSLVVSTLFSPEASAPLDNVP